MGKHTSKHHHKAHPSRLLIYCNMSIFFRLFIYLFILASCAHNRRSRTAPPVQDMNQPISEQKGKRLPRHSNQEQRNKKFSKQQITDAQVEQKQARPQAIVLLHGLSRLSYDFMTMQKVLKEKFPDITIVALKGLNKNVVPGQKKQTGIAKDIARMVKGITRDKNHKIVCNSIVADPAATAKLSIKEQAKSAYNEIKISLRPGMRIVLVGHSQGGLRGFTLAKEYAEQLQNECGITIEKLITIGTPWKGAIHADYAHIRQTVKKLNKLTPLFNRAHPDLRKAMGRHVLKGGASIADSPLIYLCKLQMASSSLQVLQGLSDLECKSDFIQHYVASGLKKIGIPITAIAGVATDFSQLFDTFSFNLHSSDLARLNKGYASLIGGDPNCEHDMLLPVSSQHAEGLDKSNFECVKVYAACHGNKVGMSVKTGVPQLQNSKVIEIVIDRISKTFAPSKPEEIKIPIGH